MPCRDCSQASTLKHAERLSIEVKAQKLANESGEWVIIYQNEEGGYSYALASSGQYPYPEYITPQLQNSDV